MQVRAWPLGQGTECFSLQHFQHGYIRAQVCVYTDFKQQWSLGAGVQQAKPSNPKEPNTPHMSPAWKSWA